MRFKCKIETRINFWNLIMALCTFVGLGAVYLILFDFNQRTFPSVGIWSKTWIIVIAFATAGYSSHRITHWKEERYRLFSELGINDLWSGVWEYSQWRDFWNPKVQEHLTKYPQDLQPATIHLAKRYGFELDL